MEDQLNTSADEAQGLKPTPYDEAKKISRPQGFNDGMPIKFAKPQGIDCIPKGSFAEFNEVTKIHIHTTYEDSGNCICPGEQWFRMKGTSQTGAEIFQLQVCLRKPDPCCDQCCKSCCKDCCEKKKSKGCCDGIKCSCMDVKYHHYDFRERSLYGTLFGESIEVKIKYRGFILLYIGQTLQAMSWDYSIGTHSESCLPEICQPRGYQPMQSHHAANKHEVMRVYAVSSTCGGYCSCLGGKEDIMVEKNTHGVSHNPKPDGFREDSCCSKVWDHYDVSVDKGLNQDQKLTVLLDMINQIIVSSYLTLLSVSGVNSPDFL